MGSWLTTQAGFGFETPQAPFDIAHRHTLYIERFFLTLTNFMKAGYKQEFKLLCQFEVLKTFKKM